jgi:hypothetical protein
LQDDKPSFTDILGIAEEVIDEIGLSTPSKSPGRPRTYDWKLFLAVLLCKGVLSFSNLKRKLRDTGYCKVEGCTEIFGHNGENYADVETSAGSCESRRNRKAFIIVSLSC